MLKREDWGFTNPVVSDLYGKPPLVWKDMDIHLVVYETDLENIEKVFLSRLKPERTRCLFGSPILTWALRRVPLARRQFMSR